MKTYFPKVIFFLLFSFFSFSQKSTSKERWVSFHLQRMSLEEKIGQLFMIPAWTRPSQDNYKFIVNAIKKYHIGGIIFMQGSPQKQIAYANKFQRLSSLPLLVAQDAEWGPAMRLDSLPKLPKQITLGALTDDSLLYSYGKYMARLCRAVGVHINFAPVVDVNVNPDNPVINFRSFGEDKHNVTRKALMIMHGMQDNGVFATAKHFPGHGDTDKDSHYSLPVIKHSAERFRDVELYPFKNLIQRGVKAIMAAHLYAPALDSTPNLPVSLSPKVIQGLLRDSMKFDGLIFTDALTMHGVTKYFPAGKIEVQAILAGNDILLFPSDLKIAFESIKQAVFDSVITEEQIDEHVRRILTAKYELGLHQFENRFTSPNKIQKLLHSDSLQMFRRKIYKSAITLVKNEVLFLPMKNLDKEKVAYIQIGYDKFAPFYHYLNKYSQADGFIIHRKQDGAYLDSLAEIISEKYSTIILGIFRVPNSPRRDYGMNAKILDVLCSFNRKNKKTIVALFGNPYALKYFKKETAIILSYEEDIAAQEGTAEVIFGALNPKGNLPITTDWFKYPAPYPEWATRFGFALPQEVGMKSDFTKKIDSLMNYAIYKRFTPGGEVLVLKNGKIVHAKTYGFETYAKKQPITYQHLYDVASLTKVVATTLATMKLYDEGRINLFAPIHKYLPETRRKPIGKIKVIKLLLHETGMPPFIPYWKTLMTQKNTWDTLYLRREISEKFSIPITDSLFLRNDFPDTLFEKILNIPLSSVKKYKYSDFNMIILSKIIEEITGKSLEEYLNEVFYKELGMFQTMFQPKLKCVPYRSVPTEYDIYFRKDTVQGYVHDENAALLGGIAGHAGIFTTMFDLAKLAYMLENSGEYGGECLLSPSTIAYFTKRFSPASRRGLGWDKPETSKNKPSPTSRLVSPYTFGHLGFTGTAIWIDPQNDLAIIILSNRTFPSRENKGFVSESIRTRIVDYVYQSLEKQH